MAKQKNLFTYINAINHKNKEEFDKKLCNSYILTLWMSHSYDIIDIVNDINMYQFKLDDEGIYKYYWHKVPKKNRFIKWIKKETFDKEKLDEIEELAKKYNISKREAQLSLI